jgi:hypothetical protein
LISQSNSKLILFTKQSKPTSIIVSSNILPKSLAYAFNSESFNTYQNSLLLTTWQHLEETQNYPKDLFHNKNRFFSKEKRKNDPIIKADHLPTRIALLKVRQFFPLYY